MMKTQVFTLWELANKPVNKNSNELLKRRKLEEKVNPFLKDVFFFIVSFLVSRVCIFNCIQPFGMAFYAATHSLITKRSIVAAAYIMGMLSTGFRQDMLLYLATMALFKVFILSLVRHIKLTAVSLAIIAAISALIPKIISMFFIQILLYEILKSISEAVTVGFFTYIFKKTICLCNENDYQLSNSQERAMGFTVLIALMICGLSDTMVWGVCLRNVGCVLIVLFVGFRFGSAIASASGVIAGLIICFSTSAPAFMISTFAFCGFLCGTLRKIGKLGVFCGFVLGNAVVTYYITGSSEYMIYLYEITISGILFLIIPVKFFDVLYPLIGGNGEIIDRRKDYIERVKELTYDRLRKFAFAFSELATTFNKISETKALASKQDISTMFNRVAEKVCKNCSLMTHCWDRNFYSTYQAVFKMMELLEQKGCISQEEFPSYLTERCIKIDDFIHCANNLYDVFKIDMIWKKKVIETRGLISQQFEGLSRIISHLAQEINVDIKFKEEYETEISTRLSEAGIAAIETSIFHNKWEKYDILVIVKKDNECNDGIIEKIEKLCSKVLKKKISYRDGEDFYYNDEYCRVFRFIEVERYNVLTGVAKMAKDKGTVSGDTYTFVDLENGRYMIALSDGMGCGHKAFQNSSATINLLEQLLQAGFDKDTAVKIINSILVLKSAEEEFATIDLSILNLQTAEAEFIKIGAVPTFIKRHNDVEMVKASSLPAGILSNVDMELTNKKLISGNVVIMLSDGVLDSIQNNSTDNNLIHDFILSIDSTNPQEIAEMILNKAQSSNCGKVIDDMTVLVTKIWEHA